MKRLKFIIILLITFISSNAQTHYGTTGLLHMPTADMNDDKTFMFGSTLMHPNTLPSKEWWGNYHTFNYYLNITIFPWLEIGYTCVLVKGKPGIYHWPEQTWGKFVNQDRSFHGKLRIWKEGWWKEWTPQISIGLNDPTTGSWEGGGSSNNERLNGFFCRYYIAATKHILFKNYGNLGAHFAYVYNKKVVNHLNGFAFGLNYRFNLPTTNSINKIVNGLNIMIDYDTKYSSFGFCYSTWKDRINLYADLYDCKHFSGGIQFKIPLK